LPKPRQNFNLIIIVFIFIVKIDVHEIRGKQEDKQEKDKGDKNGDKSSIIPQIDCEISNNHECSFNKYKYLLSFEVRLLQNKS